MTTLGGETVTIHVGTADGMPTSGLLGLDVESRWMGDQAQWDPEFRVRLVQLATKSEAWVFDVSDPEQRQYVADVLADANTTFTSHTPMDVMAVWTQFGIDIAPRNVDTRMLAIMADPDKDEDRDLKTLATAYGMPELEAADQELYAWMLQHWIATGGKKNAAKSAVEEAGWNALAEMPADEWPEVYTRYAGLDAIACRRLVELLVPATQNPPELIEVDQWLHVVANQLQQAGKRVDQVALGEMLTEARLVTGTAKSKAMDLTGGVNIDGPKIQPWLAEHGVDWDVWEGGRSKTTGAPSLAKENMRLLASMEMDDVAREVVAEMQTYKSMLDILRKTEDISKKLVVEADGIARIHPALNPIGASTTARMSASGPNMQNFSKKDPRLRGLFLPEPGHTLLTIDFAQVELRVVAALAREQKMIDVILDGGDLHELTVELLAGMGVTITRDVGKMTNFLCVPSEGEHEAEILTRRGWLRHDEVVVGDETMGYDNGVMRWTPVQAVHHYEDAELVRLGNGQSWSAVCTPHHRWVEQRRRFVDGQRKMVDGFVRAVEVNSESRLLLSAPAETDTNLDLTAAECALIGWAYSDGSVRISDLTMQRSQGSDGRRRHVRVDIFQSKPEGISEIVRVLEGIEHSTYVRPAVGGLRPITEFRIATEVARGIWRRAGLLDGASLPELVLLMSREQREAFSKAVFDAEGHVGPQGQRIIGQNAGEMCDAIEMAAFLDGQYVRKYAATHRGNKPFHGMTLSKPRVTGQRMVKTPAGRSNVWCVTTGLGSWVMRQNGKIMLTGNCVYGGGGQALHDQAGIPLEEAYTVVRTQKEAYPSIDAYSKWLGMEKDAIRTVSHRRLPVTRNKKTGDIRAYANVNYEVQSSARECLVHGWRRLESKMPGLVWFPVHDELVLQVPEGREQEVKEIAEWAMTFDFRGVPIEAEAVVLRDREGVSRWMTGKAAEQIQKEQLNA